ncbi:MAG: hypothetical protein ACT4QG_03440 [Sporichthyaceae bacterium]
MDTKELRRAYATLGLDDRASLAEARVAYLTWVALMAEPIVSGEDDQDDVDAPIDLLHHELDLAWHAIEQAHKAGVLFPRQQRGCQGCGASPAVRVTTHFVGPGRFRKPILTESAVLCRECGLRVARAARRTARSGWRGILRPVGTGKAWTRNSTEIAFLRRLKSGRPAPKLAVEPTSQTGVPGLVGHRAVAVLASIAAVALMVGIALPTGSGASQEPTAPTTSQANSLGHAKG